jgi:hypothetical protein
MVKYLLLILVSFCTFTALAQSTISEPAKAPVSTRQDTALTKQDTASTKQDTALGKIPVPATLIPKKVAYPSYQSILASNAFFKFQSSTKSYLPKSRPAQNGKEALFYVLAGLLLYLGILRGFFGRYLQNLVKVFFRASLKQRQMREQLLQSPLPSLLLNFFFITVCALFIALLTEYYHILPVYQFWEIFGFAWVAVLVIYLLKFLTLKFVGWVFQLSAATDTYIFIIFLVNKLLSIGLLPLLVVIAFGHEPYLMIWITLAFVLVAATFCYRYFSAFAPIRKEIKLSQLHFLLYLCAFEIVPLLLIYKVLANILERSV